MQRFVLALLASLLPLVIALPGAAKDHAGVTRIVRFKNGDAVIKSSGPDEHVVIRDANGKLESDSYCDAGSGTYDQIVELGLAVRAASITGDRAAMADLVEYPLRVNTSHGRSVEVKSKADLLAHFREIFSATVIERLRELEPHEVFCRNGMSMPGGDGVVWASVDRRGVLKIAVVNA